MDFLLYNSLSRLKEKFKPINRSEVRIYTCGPTVYSYQHIGNMRTMLLTDFIIRALKYNSFSLKHVINYTDVGHLTSDSDSGDDKIEKAAKKENLSVSEIVNKYINQFELDVKKLNIHLGKRVKATDHIDEQINLIKKLEKKGFVYKVSDGIYFDSSKFKNYGSLGGLSSANIKAGKRISLKQKKNFNDFALWKFSSKVGKRQQEWNSPWGIGFPGWHIECSAMSMKYLGETFDIHIGGQDLSQIHHNNEIAQSEAASGKKFVNYWVHGAFVLFNDKKVSKSTGGFYTISDLEKLGYYPLHFRYLCLLTHYRKPLNFTLENLDSAKISFDRIKKKIIKLRQQEHKGKDFTKFYSNKFLEAINDDLNLPCAVKVFLNVLDDFNFDINKKISLLTLFDEIFGLGISKFKEEKISMPKKVSDLIKKREIYRKNKEWEKADILRQRIRDKGFLIEDTSEGSKIEKIK